MALPVTQGVQQVLAQYGTLIEKYRGDIPAAVVASRIWAETRGVACPKPTACCDEQGLLQLWPATRAKYGVTDACDPDQNLRGGLAHWNSELQGLQAVLRTLGLTATGNDLWKLADLYTAIGAGATKKLLTESRLTDYAALIAWTQARLADGALAGWSGYWGTQSPSTIATRVARAGDRIDAAMGGGEQPGELGLTGGVVLGLLVWGLWKVFKG